VVTEGLGNNAKRKGLKKPRKMTAGRLQNIALYYCQRYVVSENKLSDYLTQRIYREVKDSEERQEMFDLIPPLVEKMAGSGYVNDKEAASAKLRSALRSGYATNRAVYLASRSSMVDGEKVGQQLGAALEDALPDIATDDFDASAAAMALSALQRAKRGPFRTGRMDETTERRDISWLQRRGYSFDDIKKAMGLD
jgi:SOS response regulatory protein OraA/RecX